jgi:hypothetical protein
LPSAICVTDHAGSFVDYEGELADRVAAYAQPVCARRTLVPNAADFATTYVEAFVAKIVEMQAAYRARRRAFDELFGDRPFDTNGSGAYRWSCALARLDRAQPEEVRRKLLDAIQC